MIVCIYTTRKTETETKRRKLNFRLVLDKEFARDRHLHFLATRDVHEGITLSKEGGIMR